MTLPIRLKTTQLSSFREQVSATQGGRCALCSLPLSKPCADHDHSTGAMRGVLHNGCNALLGKLENNYKRYGVVNLAAFTNGVAAYLQKHQTNVTGLLHPTYRTEDESRLLRNTRARKARANKRATP